MEDGGDNMENNGTAYNITFKSYQWLRCFFGLHKYGVFKEIEVSDKRGNIVGTNIVSRCSNCGKIKVKFVFKEYSM